MKLVFTIFGITLALACSHVVALYGDGHPHWVAVAAGFIGCALLFALIVDVHWGRARS